MSPGLPSTSLATHFCQAARQALSIPSPQLCVSLASGGDPTYAFNVRLAGEEVHGTSTRLDWIGSVVSIIVHYCVWGCGLLYAEWVWLVSMLDGCGFGHLYSKEPSSVYKVFPNLIAWHASDDG